MTSASRAATCLLVVGSLASQACSTIQKPQDHIVLGSEVRLVRYEPSPFEAAPIVAPSEPLNLEMYDCRGFEMFDTAQSGYDPETKILLLEWTEGDRPRTLAIHAGNPSCSSNPGIHREVGVSP
ncbi:MAG: hypothetical protein ACLGH3_10085 [Actinomycetota bacterium]